MNGLNYCYRCTCDIIEYPVGNNLLLIPVHANVAELDTVISLNKTGRQLWANLSGGHKPMEFCDSYQTMYRHRAADIHSAVTQCLQTLSPLIEPIIEI